MPRIAADEYVLRLNLTSGSVVRRFCEVHVKAKNEVYVFQPRKGGSVKVSYHASGERHLKHGSGPAMFTLQLDKPEWIRSEEPCWEKSFENFASLLPYCSGQPEDEVFDIDLPTPSTDTITFAQVSIGRVFDRQAWNEDGVTLTTLQAQAFPVTKSVADFSICLRVLQLRHD